MSYWLSVVALGLVVGLSVQFVQAWTNPTTPPPGGNVAGPLTTGAVAQEKIGALTVDGTLATNRMYDLKRAGDKFTQDSAMFVDPNGTSTLNGVAQYGLMSNYQTSGYALRTYGNADATEHTKAKDQIGSINVNDVFVRSAGKWASEIANNVPSGTMAGSCVQNFATDYFHIEGSLAIPPRAA